MSQQGITLRGTFTHTFEDLEEATQPVNPQLRRVSDKRTKSIKSSGAFGWMLFTALAVAFFLLMRGKNPTPMTALAPVPKPTTQPLLPFLAVPAAPIAVISLFVCAVVVGALRKTSKQSKGKPKSENKMTLTVWLSIITSVVAVAVVIVINTKRFQVDWNPTTSEILGVGLLPWAFAIFIWGWLFKWLGRSQLKRSWETQDRLRLQETIEVNDEGIRLTNIETDQLYRWRYFKRVHETDHLFVLHNETGVTFHIIPKRAFPTGDDALILRAILEERIADGDFLASSSAFPVIPVAKVARASTPSTV